MSFITKSRDISVLQVIFVFSLRQEPVLFLGSQEDFIPHSLRHREKLRRLYFSDLSPVQADENEAAIRKEVSVSRGDGMYIAIM